jgi:adenine-specific DNA-methyltransferase
MSPRLELVWPGKDKFLLVPKDEEGKPVWVDTDHPAAREVRLTDFTYEHGEVNDEDPFADNLLFTGDSLDVLRVLREVPEFARHYRGKVKLVYIDPPFNTGQTFTHYDDWMEHSTWLSFMRDRLLLIKDLLASDGSVWVHLDDAEVHRMRCLMDEVFGGENFVATVVWQKADSPRMDAKQFSSSHDSILVYGRSTGWEPNRRDQAAVDPDQFPYVELDGRRYKSSPLRKWGTNSARADRPKLWYSITAPDGTVVWPIKPDGTEGNWRWQASKVEKDAGLLQWIDKGSGMQPYVKEYADQERKPVPPVTWWSNDVVGHNRAAKAHSKQLFGRQEAFATPKPEQLLHEVVFAGTNSGDIVIDCFGGSGTTASVAHKMSRRWVTAEVLPSTVATFTAERLKRVADGKDPGGVTDAVEWKGGSGFRQVTVAPSMYEITALGVMLADWATNGRFARAVAGQLGFEWQTEKHTPFCGVRGRMRLAVFDGAVGIEEAREVIAALEERERVTIVAKVVLPGVEEFVAEQSKGSRVKKAPRDLLAGRSRRVRKREEGTA